MIIDSYMENGFYSTDNSMVAELADITPVDYSSCATVDEACMTAYLETVNEYNTFETALREAEIAYVQEHGVAPIYEAANIKELANQAITKVKEWVAKMMGVLDRFMKEVAAKIAAARTSLFKGNQEKFAKGTWSGDLEDYNYLKADNMLQAGLINVDASKLGKDDIESEINSQLNKYGVTLSDCTVKNIREKALGKKEKLDETYAKNAIVIIQGGFKHGLESINKQKKDVKDSAGKIIKAIKDVAKDASKDEKKVYRTAITAAGKINSTNNILISAKLSIMMGYLNQSYKIAGMMYRSARKSAKGDKKKDEAVNAAARIVGF